MKSECETVFVRHLPSCFTEDDCIDFFKQFGAIRTQYMGKNGAMKHTAFVTFETVSDASIVLNKLHQLSFLGTTLVVEYSKRKEICSAISGNENGSVWKSPHAEEDTSESSVIEEEKNKLKRKLIQELNSISSIWKFDYSLNKRFRYSYPPPTVSTLTNIVNTLASVPKFYVQVLHLMNKMNLPPPFGPATVTPPLFDDVQQSYTANIPAGDDMPSDLESEIESDGEEAKSKNSLKRKSAPKTNEESLRKRMKMQLSMEAHLQSLSSSLTKHSVVSEEMFETCDMLDKVKKIDIRINAGEHFGRADTAQITENLQESEPDLAGLGFGKIIPKVHESSNISLTDANNECQKVEFMSKKEMMESRMSQEELDKLNVFKKHTAGKPTNRLYIINLAKTVTKDDLHKIFGNYVDWNKQEEVNEYDISVMTGRNKGRAYVKLPSEMSAKTALNDTNGLVLLGKPMAVQFSTWTGGEK